MKTMAMLAAAVASRLGGVFPISATHESWGNAPTRLARSAPREKYPGQRTAYLAGAARTMAADQVRAHNKAVRERNRARAQRRAERDERRRWLAQNGEPVRAVRAFEDEYAKAIETRRRMMMGGAA